MSGLSLRSSVAVQEDTRSDLAWRRTRQQQDPAEQGGQASTLAPVARREVHRIREPASVRDRREGGKGWQPALEEGAHGASRQPACARQVVLRRRRLWRGSRKRGRTSFLHSTAARATAVGRLIRPIRVVSTSPIRGARYYPLLCCWPFLLFLLLVLHLARVVV